MFNCFTQDESRFLQESTRFQPQNLVWPQGEEVTKGAKGVWQINKDIIITIIIRLVCLFVWPKKSDFQGQKQLPPKFHRIFLKKKILLTPSLKRIKAENDVAF